MATPAENSARQRKFLEGIKAKGYVVLSSLYVPAHMRDSLRKLVNDEVKKWEAQQTKF